MNYFYRYQYNLKLFRWFYYIIPLIAIGGLAVILTCTHYYFVRECNKLYFSDTENADEVNDSFDKYIQCTEDKLCDISVYGGCPGTSFDYFSIGISILAFLAFFLVNFRTNIWAAIFY